MRILQKQFEAENCEIVSVSQLLKQNPSAKGNIHWVQRIKNGVGGSYAYKKCGYGFEPTDIKKDPKNYYTSQLLMKIGTDAEKYIREVCAEELKKEYSIFKSDFVYFKKPFKYDNLEFYALMDGLAINKKTKETYNLEIKNLAINYDPNKFISDKYLIQATHYMFVSGLKKTLFCLRGSFERNYVVFKYDVELELAIKECLIEDPNTNAQEKLKKVLLRVKSEYIEDYKNNDVIKLTNDPQYYFDVQRQLKSNITKTYNKLENLRDRFTVLKEFGEMRNAEKYDAILKRMVDNV